MVTFDLFVYSDDDSDQQLCPSCFAAALRDSLGGH